MYRACKYVTRLLETVYPEMIYTDDVQMKDVTCFVYKGAAITHHSTNPAQVNDVTRLVVSL